MDEVCNIIRDKIYKELEYLGEISDTELQEKILQHIKEYQKDNYLSIDDRLKVGRQIFNSMRKLGLLQKFLDDPSVTEIMVNGPTDIFVEKDGYLHKLNQAFESEEQLRDIIQQIVAKCNRVVNEASPIVDARLEDGSRVNVVLNPVALNGPILTIRRFPKDPLLMSKLVEIGSISSEAVEDLKKWVKAGYNIIVSGGTGSGKTTFLNALSSFIPQDERIITIEDSAELQIQGIDNLVRLETKNANVESAVPITIRDLIKTSLRMRPSRIVVGEVRGMEAMDMVCSAMNCGHDGSMSTVHANSASDTIGRLETMILMAVELPVSAIRRQISSGVDIIVHLGRMRDKSRKVLEISEIKEYRDGEILFNQLYKFEETKIKSVKVQGKLVKKGSIIHDEKLKAAGIEL